MKKSTRQTPSPERIVGRLEHDPAALLLVTLLVEKLAGLPDRSPQVHVSR